MEQRKDTKWKSLRKDLNQIAQMASQLSHAALMIDADLRSMRKELTDSGYLKPIEQETSDEQPEEAKTEDYFPAKDGIAEANQAPCADQADNSSQG